VVTGDDGRAGQPLARRADARRNEQALLDAAAAVFVRAGVDAPVREIAEKAGEAGRWLHWGATTQDIMDTAVVLQIGAGLDLLEADLAAARGHLADLARRHRDTAMAGRTHLQHALPITFGYKAAIWLSGLDRHAERLAQLRPRVLLAQFGGAAGTLASLGDDGPRVVALLAEELGLARPVLPWHTDRLRIIDLAAALARVTAALGKIARDVTLLAQSEIAEVSEGGGPAPRDAASPRRGGSSAMPHKHNPVASIAILGCTRQVPGLLATLVACAEQELQRAAGAWHAEWEPLTALLRLTGSAASWAAELLSGLTVDASRMAANLAATKDLPLAEHVTSLLAGVLGGVQAHDLVAEAGQRAVSAGLPLRDVLLAVPKLEGRLASAGITPEQIESALEPAGYLGATDAFVTAALAAHEALDAQLSKGG